MKYTRADLVIVTKLMGVPTGRCGLCHGVGDPDAIEHTDDCPLGSDLVVAIQLHAILDKEKMCGKCDGHGDMNHWFGNKLPKDADRITCPDCRGSGLQEDVEQK
jgi:DnaJ-class molecular chaperone